MVSVSISVSANGIGATGAAGWTDGGDISLDDGRVDIGLLTASTSIIVSVVSVVSPS